MAKKRKTLPADFEQIVTNAGSAELQAIFDKCDINAYGGFWKGNALTFCGINEEFIQWLVTQGIDLNAGDTWGYRPVSYQAEYSSNNLKVLLELGADIEKRDNYNCTPLCNAVSKCHIQAVTALLENGADVHSLNGNGSDLMTPLEKGLAHCSNIDICKMAEIADMLLAAGAKTTPKMKNLVKKIGETFEFYRADFNKDYLPTTEQALEHLYHLFDAEPVAKRNIHNGIDPILVKSSTWQQQFAELWEMLIPGTGHAKTVQGEVIRITGKVSREILDNGAPNWNKGYKKLPQALPMYFAMGNQLPPQEHEEARSLSLSVSANSEDDTLNRLCELAVWWVLLNPEPIALQGVDYER
ncbi:ankyrin repeat domain-containing protein [Bacteroides sp. 224]|uniref:ankyrin repeat domain-containing protein n=1 Tax=Bacteroides sp. 224 TaxID=2302936 RepID=UPI0013D19E54|nr:ankyrin repeat domain-containing protein [Bacteroides sp. 224]NDV66681.1 hypothetical protein [Bacteroides sp. 224]